MEKNASVANTFLTVRGSPSGFECMCFPMNCSRAQTILRTLTSCWDFQTITYTILFAILLSFVRLKAYTIPEILM